VQNGSIILLMLLVCFGLAVVVQTLSVVTLCAARAKIDESAGRETLAAMDEGLASLRTAALISWGPLSARALQTAGGEVEGSVAEPAEDGGWVLEAAVRKAGETGNVPKIRISAWLERGRDGLDLPLAGLVAAAVTVAPDRTSPWLEDGGEHQGLQESLGEDGSGSGGLGRPTAWLRSLPLVPLVGPGVTIATAPTVWRLDEGWREFFEEAATTPAPGSPGLRAGQGLIVTIGRPGETVPLPVDWGAASSDDAPALFVLTGGATLDARGRGDICGVMVVDGGDVLLDGTVLRGAVVTTGVVGLGQEGCVSYSPSVLRWATDRALMRVRLVPGTRWESIE
jgi:hypothetical protein